MAAARPAAAATLLALFFVSVLVPGTMAVGGIDFGFTRLLLLVCFVPLALRWLGGAAGRITSVDVCIVAHCLWIGVALMAVHGMGQVPFAISSVVEMLGGYLIGRVLVRDAADYARFVRYLFVAVLFLLPFAVLEIVTGRSLLRDVAGAFMNVLEPGAGTVARLGLKNRVQGPFGHAILFGLFCSLGVANFYYVYKDGLVKRLSRVGLAVFMTFVSLSSAPLLSAGVQMLMMAWDQIMRFLRARWKLLVVTAGLVFAVLQTLTPDGALEFVISNFTFVPETGIYRLYIWEYGRAEVVRNPVFGIGLNDWERAYWMHHASVDNFLLLTAMRYGLPGIMTLLLGLGLHFWRTASARGLSEEAARFRTGYLIASLGLFMTLGTVHIWGSLYVFVMAYIGAGSWFYTGAATAESPHDRRLRRAAPARRGPRPDDPAAGRGPRSPIRRPAGRPPARGRSDA